MTLLKTEEGKEIVSRVTLKKVKLNIGHDLAGMFAEFYLDGKKMGYFSDDGYGGGTEIVYNDPALQTIFEEFLKENNVAQIMFDNGWDFLKDASKIDLHTQAEEVINEALNAIQLEKANKKLIKHCLSNICIGNDENSSYRMIGFKSKQTFKEIAATPQGRGHIEALYFKYKSALEKGEKILNTNLEELGIKL